MISKDKLEMEVEKIVWIVTETLKGLGIVYPRETSEILRNEIYYYLWNKVKDHSNKEIGTRLTNTKDGISSG